MSHGDSRPGGGPDQALGPGRVKVTRARAGGPVWGTGTRMSHGDSHQGRQTGSDTGTRMSHGDSRPGRWPGLSTGTRMSHGDSRHDRRSPARPAGQGEPSTKEANPAR